MSALAIIQAQDETHSAIDAARGTYFAALATLKAEAFTASLHKADNDAANKAVNAAQRQVAWSAFDLVTLLPTSERKDAASEIGREIAETRNKPTAAKVYAQRMREACTKYAANVAQADRAKADPLSVSARLAKRAATYQEAVSQDAPFMADAMEAAAGDLEMPSGMFQAMIVQGDPLARQALEIALKTLKERAALVDTFKAALTTLASVDDATYETVRGMIETAFGA